MYNSITHRSRFVKWFLKYFLLTHDNVHDIIKSKGCGMILQDRSDPGGKKMQNSKRIKGMDILLHKLPKEYQHWHLFGNILSLSYEKAFDYETKFEEVSCIDMMLTDRDCKYKLRVRLTDVSGYISFDVTDGFFSGLTIEDSMDKYSAYGWETERCFIMTSFEPDVDLEIRCESVSVELID